MNLNWHVRSVSHIDLCHVWALMTTSLLNSVCITYLPTQVQAADGSVLP